MSTITPNYVPREYKTINVVLLVKNAHEALRFYNSAFGAEVIMQLEDSHGVIVHAELRIEDTIIMLQEAPTESKNSGVGLMLYTGDCEALFESAIRAGGEEVSPIKNKFYGDRSGRIKDPFGHEWILATHVEDVPARELKKRFDELYP